MLKKAGLIDVRAGVGGASLLKKPEEISLLEVYRAVHAAEEDQLFRVHENSNIQCSVGRNIEIVLQSEFREAQRAMEQRLAQTTLEDLRGKFV